MLLKLRRFSQLVLWLVLDIWRPVVCICVVRIFFVGYSFTRIATISETRLHMLTSLLHLKAPHMKPSFHSHAPQLIVLHIVFLTLILHWVAAMRFAVVFIHAFLLGATIISCSCELPRVISSVQAVRVVPCGVLRRMIALLRFVCVIFSESSLHAVHNNLFAE